MNISKAFIRSFKNYSFACFDIFWRWHSRHLKNIHVPPSSSFPFTCIFFGRFWFPCLLLTAPKQSDLPLCIAKMWEDILVVSERSGDKHGKFQRHSTFFFFSSKCLLHWNFCNEEEISDAYEIVPKLINSFFPCPTSFRIKRGVCFQSNISFHYLLTTWRASKSKLFQTVIWFSAAYK